MSKIARLPVKLPQSVSLKVVPESSLIEVSSNGQKVSYPFNNMVEMTKTEDVVEFKLKAESRSRTARSILGTTYATLKRAIVDIQSKYLAKVQLKGVGYKAIYANNMLTLSLGFSHPVKIATPQSLEITVTQNTLIEIKGYDRRVVMELATAIRKLRKPEPYKGKGVFINDETISIKEGKKK